MLCSDCESLRLPAFMQAHSGNACDLRPVRVLIIIAAEVIGHHEGTIGNPTPYSDPNAPLPAAQQGNGAPQPQPRTAGPPGAPGGGYGQPPGPMYGQPPGPGGGYGGPGGSGGGFGAQGGAGPGGPYHSGPAGGGYQSGPPGGQGPYGGGAPGGGAGGAYGRPVPPPQYGGAGAVARNEAHARIMPIKSLNPFSGRWTIKGRCTSKGELRRFVKGTVSRRAPAIAACHTAEFQR